MPALLRKTLYGITRWHDRPANAGRDDADWRRNNTKMLLGRLVSMSLALRVACLYGRDAFSSSTRRVQLMTACRSVVSLLTWLNLQRRDGAQRHRAVPEPLHQAVAR